ncbi:unnamed protein product [Haemonchus placei]|uniref:PID domain-containing protein n=1 Tax=Haemonchus placei TaxID=6290 RepID=A0A0N4WK40_HAEPC|nr:unnamed protein product [Haemonchus placei]
MTPISQLPHYHTRFSLPVDNTFLSANIKEQAIDKHKETEILFKPAGMNVRQWTTSDTETNKIIALKENASAEEAAKIFSMQCDVESDTLTSRLLIAEEKSSDPTKRNVFKEVASGFEPLRLIAPVAVEGKIFQRSTKRKPPVR